MEILESIYWWLTHNTATQEMYHTLWHCIQEDLDALILLIIALLLICIFYLGIAKEGLYLRKKYPNSEIQKGITYFVLVFVFCSLTGYAMRIIMIWLPIYKVLIGVLYILAFIAFLLWRAMKRSELIQKILQLEDQLHNQVHS